MDIIKETKLIGNYLISLRKDFHKHPELGMEEYRTSKRIKEELDKIEKYNLEERNGFIFSKKSINEKKSTIRMIKEGSIVSDRIEGKIFTYTSDFGIINHTVYVYGRQKRAGSCRKDLD